MSRRTYRENVMWGWCDCCGRQMKFVMGNGTFYAEHSIELGEGDNSRGDYALCEDCYKKIREMVEHEPG